MRSGELAKTNHFFGLRFRSAFHTDFDSIAKFVVYEMNQPFVPRASGLKSNLAIGMQLKDSIGKPDLLVLGFENKKLIHEARSIARIIDKPLEISLSVEMSDTDLINGDEAEGLSTSTPKVFS